MEPYELMLASLERIEKRLDKQEEKMDMMVENVNTMKVNAAGCSAHFEEVDRQVEALEKAPEKRQSNAEARIGIVGSIVAIIAVVMGWIFGGSN